MIGKTNKSKPKLCLDGYFYTIERISESNEKCVWKCERTGNKTTPKCPGRCHSKYLNSKFFGPIEHTKEHNHMPMPEKTDAVLALGKILERATITGHFQVPQNFLISYTHSNLF